MNHSESSQEAKTPIVTYVTQVTISLLPDGHLLSGSDPGTGLVTPNVVSQAGKQIASHFSRVTSMMELLADHGFTFRGDKKAIHCFSNEVEAGEAKRLLLAAGFKDREFQIVLEYTRGWGML